MSGGGGGVEGNIDPPLLPSPPPLTLMSFIASGVMLGVDKMMSGSSRNEEEKRISYICVRMRLENTSAESFFNRF